ncbi:hypothetical protein [Pantoea rodasii]|uniref:hypothetical protein n=1 Tax=Pantoea rodasii TaxID=1076549 RepID=UPI000AE5C54A|nr:hypothetical protein [Pantoea rodasii]
MLPEEIIPDEDGGELPSEIKPEAQAHAGSMQQKWIDELETELKVLDTKWHWLGRKNW